MSTQIGYVSDQATWQRFVRLNVARDGGAAEYPCLQLTLEGIEREHDGYIKLDRTGAGALVAMLQLWLRETDMTTRGRNGR